MAILHSVPFLLFLLAQLSILISIKREKTYDKSHMSTHHATHSHPCRVPSIPHFTELSAAFHDPVLLGLAGQHQGGDHASGPVVRRTLRSLELGC